MAGRPLRQWLLIGVAGGLLAVVVIRFALVLLLGSLKLVAVVGGLTLLWLFLRGPKDGRP
jgi:Flp pilus assembly protein TadB